jgi:hypothetical protein
MMTCCCGPFATGTGSTGSGGTGSGSSGSGGGFGLAVVLGLVLAKFGLIRSRGTLNLS